LALITSISRWKTHTKTKNPFTIWTALLHSN